MRTFIYLKSQDWVHSLLLSALNNLVCCSRIYVSLTSRSCHKLVAAYFNQSPLQPLRKSPVQLPKWIKLWDFPSQWCSHAEFLQLPQHCPRRLLRVEIADKNAPEITQNSALKNGVAIPLVLLRYWAPPWLSKRCCNPNDGTGSISIHFLPPTAAMGLAWWIGRRKWRASVLNQLNQLTTHCNLTPPSCIGEIVSIFSSMSPEAFFKVFKRVTKRILIFKMHCCNIDS